MPTVRMLGVSLTVLIKRLGAPSYKHTMCGDLTPDPTGKKKQSSTSDGVSLRRIQISLGKQEPYPLLN